MTAEAKDRPLLVITVLHPPLRAVLLTPFTSGTASFEVNSIFLNPSGPFSTSFWTLVM